MIHTFTFRRNSHGDFHWLENEDYVALCDEGAKFLHCKTPVKLELSDEPAEGFARVTNPRDEEKVVVTRPDGAVKEFAICEEESLFLFSLFGNWREFYVRLT